MSVELGSFWLIKDSGCIAIVRSIVGKSDGGLTVVYNATDNSGVSSYRMSCEYELFTNIAEKLITKSELKDELNKEYVDGKTNGYNEGYQHGFDLGYSKATEEIKSSNTGIGHLLGEEWDKGYNEAIKEMSEGESLGETVECIFGTEFFGDSNEEYPREPYPVTKGIDIIKFIKHNFDNIKSFTQVGAVANIEMFDKYNSGSNEQLEKELELVERYPHYYKDIRHLNIIDIYRFFDLFEVTDPCIQHSLKKLAVGGKRGAKDYEKDIKEAMDTLKRWEYMQEENKRGLDD